MLNEQDQQHKPKSRLWAVAMVAVLIAAGAGVALWLVPPAAGPPPVVTAVAFSPDGRFLAAAERQGGIAVWQAPSWQRAGRFVSQDGGLNTLAFSPDSRLLATVGRSLRLWRTADWQPSHTIGKEAAGYGAGRFAPDGRSIASVNTLERIEFWDAESGQLARTLCCVGMYGDLAFSPDGRTLATGGNYPRLWDLSSGKELFRLVQTREPAFGAIAFRADGRVVATGSRDGKARTWDAATASILRESQARPDHIESVAFQPNSESIAYAVRKSAVWLWNTATGAENQIAPEATSNVAFSPDGKWLCFGAPGGAIHLKSVATAEAVDLKFRD